MKSPPSPNRNRVKGGGYNKPNKETFKGSFNAVFYQISPRSFIDQ